MQRRGFIARLIASVLSLVGVRPAMLADRDLLWKWFRDHPGPSEDDVKTILKMVNWNREGAAE